MEDSEKNYIVSRGKTSFVYKDKEEVRGLIQGVIANSVNLSTLIGSGASLPAIPLMGTTFTNYRDGLKTKDPELSIHLEECIKIICNNHKEYKCDDFTDIEFFLSWLQYRIDGDVGTAEDDKRLLDNLKKVFIQSIKDDKKDEHSDVILNYVKLFQGLGRSRQILARQQKTVFDIINLFTTNYDLFHELALEKSRYAYTDGFSNGINNKFANLEFHRRPIDLEDRFKDKLQPVNPFFRLLKLHGSINWIKRDNEILRINNDINHNIDNEVIISPTSSKFALTQNIPYSDLFREFVNILAVPNSVLFTTAFSFNDSHISNLIEAALDRTDFTLYAFIENPDYSDKDSNFYHFIENVSSSPNVFFIYPNVKNEKDQNFRNPPLKFEDVAYFMQPNILDSSYNEENSGDENDK